MTNNVFHSSSYNIEENLTNQLHLVFAVNLELSVFTRILFLEYYANIPVFVKKLYICPYTIAIP